MCRIRSVRKPEKNTFSITPVLYDAPFLQGTPANIRINLIWTESRVLGYIFVPIVWVYLHSNFRGWLRKTHTF